MRLFIKANRKKKKKKRKEKKKLTEFHCEMLNKIKPSGSFIYCFFRYKLYSKDKRSLCSVYSFLISGNKSMNKAVPYFILSYNANSYTSFHSVTLKIIKFIFPFNGKQYITNKSFHFFSLHPQINMSYG